MKNRTRILLFAVTLAALPLALPARAGVMEAWVHRYSNLTSNSYDEGFKVVRDAAGDVIVTGITDDGTGGADMLTIKYSGADGSVLWQTRYNGLTNGLDRPAAAAVDPSGNVVVTGVSGFDIYTAKYRAVDGALLWQQRRTNGSPSALAVDASGNVIVTGYLDNPGRDAEDYYTAKYAAANGALLWTRTYGGPIVDEGRVTDVATAVAVDPSGNVVVTGYSRNEYYTLKYAAANGAIIWEQRFNPGDSGRPYAVAVDSIGNVIVTGSSLSDNNSPYTADYYTVKYAAGAGAVLWEKRYNGPANNEDQPRAIAVDGSDNVAVTGFSASGNDIDGYPVHDYYTAKYAGATGTLLWEKRYNDPANGTDLPQAIAVDGSGNVVVTGLSGAPFNVDYYTAKYAAANGTLLWERRYAGSASSYDESRSVIVDTAGDVFVTGTSSGDYYTARYAASDGGVLWQKRYDGRTNQRDEAQAVVVDGSGNVIVTGISYADSRGYDFYTAKYAAGSGVLLWDKRYNGPSNGNDHARAVAVDGSGNVFVTGFSSGSNGESDYYTAKYAAASGALLWEKRYNGPANSADEAQAIAVDGSGNVVVTGRSYNADDPDFYTAKYAASDGALLWEKRYNGPDRYDGGASGVALDVSGNVVVTGASWNSTGTSDYYTAKYAASNGALLWEKRYSGPNHYDAGASGVALDGDGNVAVTGGSYNGTNYDAYTAKYSAANGALLWEKRYTGATNGGAYAHAVAVDANGNVLVTGNSEGDYYTAKYAAANGALLWEKRYNGPSGHFDDASAVAVDGSGNVVVTGYSAAGFDVYDYYTAKYAASDGGLLWEKRYNGPTDRDDLITTSRSLAVAPNGTVVITGSSGGSLALNSAAYDYATVVYWENLPAITIVPDGVGGYFVRGSATPGSIYQLQRANAVVGPWSLNATAAVAVGTVEFHDTNPPPGQAFYRVVQP